METLLFIVAYLVLFAAPFFLFEEEKPEQRIARRYASNQSISSFGGSLVFLAFLMMLSLWPFTVAIKAINAGGVVMAYKWGLVSLTIIYVSQYLFHAMGVVKGYPRPWLRRLLMEKQKVA